MFVSNALFKRSLNILLVIIVSLFSVQTMDARELLVEVEKPRVATVTKVIDVEAIEVMYSLTPNAAPTIERIKLAGVNGHGNDASLDYTKNQLLGKTVFIVYDTALAITDGFKPAYIYKALEQTFNETLLQQGYGQFDTDDSKALYKVDLLKAEQIAKRQELNLWQTQSTPSNKININMASIETLMEHFGLSGVEAMELINYRSKNKINTVEELGFVLPKFTRDYLMNEGRSIHYITDVNSATLYELGTLFSTFSSLNNAYLLNDYRVFKPIQTLGDIKGQLIMTSDEYIRLQEFSTVIPNNNIFYEPLKTKVNINTATAQEIATASAMTLSQAQRIVDTRTQYNYYIRSLSELKKYHLDYFPLGLTYYADDLSIRTNINNANIDELKSLFSTVFTSDQLKLQYAKKIMDKRPFSTYSKLEQTVGFTFYKYIQPFIYIDGLAEPSGIPININTASKSSIIKNFNLTSSQISLLNNRSTAFLVPQDVFFMNSTNASKIALYTPINTASYDELLMLHSTMTKALVDKMIEYRIEMPFYTQLDLYNFLVSEKKSDLYLLIKDFIVYY